MTEWFRRFLARRKLQRAAEYCYHEGLQLAILYNALPLCDYGDELRARYDAIHILLRLKRLISPAPKQ
jgi:hypothetical protein